MTVTVWGPIADDIGATMWVDTISHTGPGGRLIAEQRSRFAALPMTEFRTRQPTHIPLDLNHRYDIGQVIHLERGARELFAVAVADDLQLEDLAAAGRLKFSTATNGQPGDVQLRSLAIVPAADAASVGLGSLNTIPGDLRYGALDLLGIGQIPPILRRAQETCRHRRYGDPLHIEEPNWRSRVETTTEGVPLYEGRMLPETPKPGDAVRRLVDDGRGGQVWAEIEHRPGRILSVR